VLRRGRLVANGTRELDRFVRNRIDTRDATLEDLNRDVELRSGDVTARGHESGLDLARAVETDQPVVSEVAALPARRVLAAVVVRRFDFSREGVSSDLGSDDVGAT